MRMKMDSIAKKEIEIESIVVKEIESPYVGLMPFEKKNEQYFFGRKNDTEVAATNLRATNITIFYGTSGVGKSSLISAGVLPHLGRIAEASIIPGEMPEFIFVMLCDWANDPTISLRENIEAAVNAAYKAAFNKAFSDANAKNKEISPIIKNLGARIREIAEANKAENNKGETTLFSILKSWTDLLEIKFLVILDQFEVFLSDENKFKFDVNPFSEQLSRVLNDRELPVNVMISLRDDTLAQLDFLKNKVPDLMKNTLRLEYLDRRAAEDAIREPLKKYSEGKNISYGIDDKLVAKLLTELEVGYKESEDREKNSTEKNVGEAAAPEASAESESEEKSQKKYQVQTPDLQLVMSRLWEEIAKPSEAENAKAESAKEEGAEPKITLKEKKEKKITCDTLDALGGIEGIRNSYLDEVMEKNLSEAERIKAAKFIHLTVSMSGAKRSSTVEELHFGFNDKELARQDIKDILDKLTVEGGSYKGIYKKIKNRSEDDAFKSYFYEVTHDTLVPSILNWRKRENEKVLRRSRRNKAFKYTAAIFLIILIPGIVLYVFRANDRYLEEQTQNRINNYSQVIEDQQNELNQKDSIIELLVELQSDKKDGSAELMSAIKEENIVKIKQITEQSSKEAKADPETVDKKNAILNIITKDLILMKPQNNPSKSVDAPLIFIQYVKQDDKPKANDLRNLLNNKGFLAPGVEYVDGVNIGNQIQLRYFTGKYSDKTLNDALNYLNCIFQNSGNSVKKQQISGYENSTSIRQNQFELWFTINGIPDINPAAGSKCSAAAN